MPSKGDLRAAVGQLLIMGFEGTEVSGRLKTCIAALQPGGVILFARNIADAGQTHRLLAQCQELVKTPLFTCVDMEGGTVDRLKKVIAPAPAAANVFATGKKELYRRHGRLIGEEACALGFNTNFAPVLDLALPASSAVLTSRAVSPDPQQTVIYAREFLRGLQDARVLGCGKHFPGLGEASLDSHYHLPTIHKPWESLWAEDIHPYRALRRQMPFVIVAHAVLPEVDSKAASFSPRWINDTLRKKVGFRGLVASDDLEMAGALAAGSVEQASVETLRAGGDIYLVCHDLDHVWGSYQAVLGEAERDPAFARQVMQAARRVETFKKKARAILRPAPAPKAPVVARLKKNMEEFTKEVEFGAMRSTTHESPMATAAK